MICAGWIRFRASLMAMRRTSWIDQRINDGVACFCFRRGSAFRFFCAGVGAMAITASWRGEHHQGNVAMPPIQDLLSL